MPSALIKIHWLDGDKDIWEEIIYRKGLTTPDFIELAKERIPEEERQREFFAGTDEPGSIQQFYDAGFNIPSQCHNLYQLEFYYNLKSCHKLSS